MTLGDIIYPLGMGRWQPDARGRLQAAALQLYADRGYAETTVADIAERAGLTKRTFFRYFADKREVLFFGSDHFRETFVTALRDAPAAASPIDTVLTGLVAIAAFMDQDRGHEFVSLRQRIIAATPELQERELIKLAQLATEASATLTERGVPPLRAGLIAETAVAVLKVSFSRWVAGDSAVPLADVMRQCADELQSALTR